MELAARRRTERKGQLSRITITAYPCIVAHVGEAINVSNLLHLISLVLVGEVAPMARIHRLHVTVTKEIIRVVWVA